METLECKEMISALKRRHRAIRFRTSYNMYTSAMQTRIHLSRLKKLRNNERVGKKREKKEKQKQKLEYSTVALCHSLCTTPVYAKRSKNARDKGSMVMLSMVTSFSEADYKNATRPKKAYSLLCTLISRQERTTNRAKYDIQRRN